MLTDYDKKELEHWLINNLQITSKSNVELIVKHVDHYFHSKQSPDAVSREEQAEWEFLTIIKANYEVEKNNNGQWKGYTCKRAVLETYEDFISIISNLPFKRSGKEKEVADYVNNLSAPQPVGDKEAACKECKLPYEDFGVDITFRDQQWKLINPNVDGLLCGTCIARRVNQLAGAIAIRAEIDFGAMDEYAASQGLEKWLKRRLNDIKFIYHHIPDSLEKEKEELKLSGMIQAFEEVQKMFSGDQNGAVSDTTGDDSSNAADYIKEIDELKENWKTSEESHQDDAIKWINERKELQEKLKEKEDEIVRLTGLIKKAWFGNGRDCECESCTSYYNQFKSENNL